MKYCKIIKIGTLAIDTGIEQCEFKQCEFLMQNF